MAKVLKTTDVCLLLLRAAIVILIVVSWPLSRVLPDWAGWEDGPIENAQAVLLLFGMSFAAYFAATEIRQSPRWLWCAAIPIWLIFLGRQLGWGADLGSPVRLGPHGPVFAAGTLWYEPAVHPVIIALLAFAGYLFIRNSGTRWWATLIRRHCFPSFEFLVAALGAMVSTAAKGHMGVSIALDEVPVQMLAKLAELVTCLALLSAQWRLHLNPGD